MPSKQSSPPPDSGAQDAQLVRPAAALVQGQPLKDVIKSFVEDWAATGYQQYEDLAQAAKCLFERKFNMKRPPPSPPVPDVKCIILARGKSSETIEKTIYRRQADRHKPRDDRKPPEGPFTDGEQIRKAMPDLAGICIILVFPDDEEKVINFVNGSTLPVPNGSLFWGVNEDGSVRIEQFDNSVKRKDRFPGYRAVHSRVSLKADLGSDQPPALQEYWNAKWKEEWANMDVEIQITSMTMYAWKEVHHDLVYKTYQGPLTTDEIATLDMVNGIVLANEIAVNQFHQRLEERLVKIRTPFRDEDDLKHWLNVYLGNNINTSFRETQAKMNYAEPLLKVLRAIELNTPEKFQGLLGKVPKRIAGAAQLPTDLKAKPEIIDETGRRETCGQVDSAIDPGNEGQHSENKSLQEILAMIQTWRQTSELDLRTEPLKFDASTWAICCICEIESPFIGATEDEATRQFIMMATFAMQIAFDNGYEMPPAADLNMRASKAVKKESTLGQMLAWAGMVVAPEKQEYFRGHPVGASEDHPYVINGRWNNFLSLLPQRLGDYKYGAAKQGLDLQVALSIALLGVTVVPYPQGLEKDLLRGVEVTYPQGFAKESPGVIADLYNPNNSVLWPGAMNVKGLAAFHDLPEADVRGELAWTTHGKISELSPPSLFYPGWESFLVIVNDGWQQVSVQRGSLLAEWEWKYVRTGVPPLLHHDTDLATLSSHYDEKWLQSPGIDLRKHFWVDTLQNLDPLFVGKWPQAEPMTPSRGPWGMPK